MAFSNPVVEAGVAGLAALYRARAVTPLEATEAYLNRIERLNPRINAFLDVDAEGARAAAASSSARWAAGRPLSPLDGVPIGVKANIAVCGLPWHAGVAAYRDRIAVEDADCVARLRAAGAVILGTLNLHEGALGATTDNPTFGRTENPHRAGFTPGGSSGGSGAAVAAGLCAAALGTDTMGSVRIPSGYCGVFGLKPGRGRVSNAGLIPLSWTLDTVGPHARSAEDCGLVMAGMAEAAGADEDRRPLAVLDWSGQVEAEPAVTEAAARTVERARALGLIVEPLRLDDYDFGAVRRLGLLVSEVEGHVVHGAVLAERPEGFSQAFAAGLAWGARQPAPRLARAYRELDVTAARVRDRLRPYRGLLSPTAPQTAFAFEDAAPVNQADFTAMANVAGLPAAAFPAGEVDGLPLSMQVMAWDEGEALALADRLAAQMVTPEQFVG
ncbi:MAG: amidase [Brevundimonas sp.]|uniref:amidase n=1 Tax=Brevundimonas sp. TaxID=1871086 RepID=UPI0025BE3451|nr:amidase [Brevundimonas sp.]MBX3478472.1 amidase [Brevundimonas sp.]